MIGHQHERTHTLRDLFGRNHIPVGFYDAGTDAARRILSGLELHEARASRARAAVIQLVHGYLAETAAPALAAR